MATPATELSNPDSLSDCSRCLQPLVERRSTPAASSMTRGQIYRTRESVHNVIEAIFKAVRGPAGADAAPKPVPGYIDTWSNKKKPSSVSSSSRVSSAPEKKTRPCLIMRTFAGNEPVSDIPQCFFATFDHTIDLDALPDILRPFSFAVHPHPMILRFPTRPHFHTSPDWPEEQSGMWLVAFIHHSTNREFAGRWKNGGEKVEIEDDAMDQVDDLCSEKMDWWYDLASEHPEMVDDYRKKYQEWRQSKKGNPATGSHRSFKTCSFRPTPMEGSRSPTTVHSHGTRSMNRSSSSLLLGQSAWSRGSPFANQVEVATQALPADGDFERARLGTSQCSSSFNPESSAAQIRSPSKASFQSQGSGLETASFVVRASELVCDSPAASSNPSALDNLSRYVADDDRFPIFSHWLSDARASQTPSPGTASDSPVSSVVDSDGEDLSCDGMEKTVQDLKDLKVALGDSSISGNSSGTSLSSMGKVSYAATLAQGTTGVPGRTVAWQRRPTPGRSGASRSSSTQSEAVLHGCSSTCPTTSSKESPVSDATQMNASAASIPEVSRNKDNPMAE